MTDFSADNGDDRRKIRRRRTDRRKRERTYRMIVFRRSMPTVLPVMIVMMLSGSDSERVSINTAITHDDGQAIGVRFDHIARRHQPS